MIHSDYYTPILAVILLGACAFSIAIYFYQPANLNPLITSNQTGAPNQNSIAEEQFLQRYNFTNDTNIVGLYNFTTGNEMILNCNYGMAPQFYTVPPLLTAENQSTAELYDTVVSYVGKATICEIDSGLPGCAVIKQDLYNFTTRYFNYTLTLAVFNQTKTYIDGYYTYLLQAIMPPSAVNSSSMFGPLLYDVNLLNATNGTESSMLLALLGLKSMPRAVINFPNGTVIDSPVYLDVPFEFPIVYYPLKEPCNSTLNVFNLISSLGTFATQTYSDIYAGIGARVTNVCINSNNNDCTKTSANNLNISFYVQS